MPPSYFDPINNPEQALASRRGARSHGGGRERLTPGGGGRHQEVAARSETLRAPQRLRLVAPSFYCQWVKEQITDNPAFGSTAGAPELLYQGGLRIETPLDPAVQQAAGPPPVPRWSRPTELLPGSRSCSPAAGRCSRWPPTARGAGRRRRSDGSHLPGDRSLPPGSTFKAHHACRGDRERLRIRIPLVRAAALRTGQSELPGRRFRQRRRRPRRAWLTAIQATWRSVNTYYVWLVEQTGVIKAAQMAQRLGMSSIRTDGSPGSVGERDASLTLGTFTPRRCRWRRCTQRSPRAGCGARRSA